MITILVVDDEAQIRRVTRLILEHAGYEVLEAASAFQALDRLDTGLALDLLIADLRMPGLNGDTMVRQLRATRPDLKVLYISGYSDLLAAMRPLSTEGILSKPFTGETLTQAVAALLPRAA